MAPKASFTSPEEFEERVEKYFKWVDSQTRITKGSKGQEKIVYQPMSVIGMCNFLKITRQTLINYEGKPEYTEVIQKARQRIEQDIIDHAVIGAYNPVFSIFHLKNHFGWKDKTEINHSANDLLTGILEGSVEHLVKQLRDDPKNSKSKNKKVISG